MACRRGQLPSRLPSRARARRSWSTAPSSTATVAAAVAPHLSHLLGRLGPCTVRDPVCGRQLWRAAGSTTSAPVNPPPRRRRRSLQEGPAAALTGADGGGGDAVSAPAAGCSMQSAPPRSTSRSTRSSRARAPRALTKRWATGRGSTAIQRRAARRELAPGLTTRPARPSRLDDRACIAARWRTATHHRGERPDHRERRRESRDAAAVSMACGSRGGARILAAARPRRARSCSCSL